MNSQLKALFGFLLMLLFIYAAASKLIDFSDFKGQMYNQTFPHWMANILIYTLPPMELVTAALLMTKPFEKAGLVISLVLLLLFTGYIALVLLHLWSRVPCSCGGILSHLSWQAHFIFNFFCLAMNITALNISAKQQPYPNIRGGL